MDTIANFQITVLNRWKKRTYTMMVEHTYSDIFFDRFRVHGQKGRYIEMQKDKRKKNNPWTLVDQELGPKAGQLDMDQQEQRAFAILEMQDAIDKYLADLKLRDSN